MILMQKEVDQLIEAMKASEIYKEYTRQKNNIEKYPELEKEINVYRQRNYELQMAVSEDRIDEETERFIREFEQFREIPMVNDFLAAELAFCKMVQEINTYITNQMSADF